MRALGKAHIFLIKKGYQPEATCLGLIALLKCNVTLLNPPRNLIHIVPSLRAPKTITTLADNRFPVQMNIHYMLAFQASQLQ
jgi:hypothetical protein